MTMTDPIADMLTRIRNANSVRKESVDVPYSIMKEELTKVLKEEGFIEAYKVVGSGVQKMIRLYYKYHGRKQDSTISKIERVSKPGRRVYVSKDDIKPVLGGLGISILSTSKGLMTGEKAKKTGIGGEVICSVW